MCGIYLTNIPFAQEEVKTKLESIQFRGPDYTGIQKVDDLTFGHLRLSILDLDVRSHQPMQFDELTIIFNGEVYNFQEIKMELLSLGYTFNTTGDTEVLLKGYKEWGEAIVPKLNGMFAFAIYNRITKKVFCSRDRLGVKPFFYSWKDGEFEICSQLRPINENKHLNEAAVSMYLDCTYIPSPFTIYQDVYKLPPGNNLEIDLNTQTTKVSEYWNLKNVSDSNVSYENAKAELHDLLKDAVKIRLQADVPFGSFLSGGIDSALISSIAANISKDPIKTFSIGFEDPKYDESKIAAQYAKIIGSEHTETICKPKDILEMLPKLIQVYDEPFGDSSALPSLLLNKVTKQYVTMALSGDGGDESFLGYNHFDWVAKFKYLIKVPYWIRANASRFLISGVLKSKTEPIKRIFNIKTKNDFIAGIFVGYNSIVKNRDLRWLSNFEGYKYWSKDLFQATADLNIKLWLENDSNVKVDRASMAYSVEVRSPFLDYRIIEFARTLPVSFRYVSGRKKMILRDILKEYIPEHVFDQPKRGFAVPIGSWIRKELREEFVENLSDNFLNQVPNLDVKKFKKMFKDHLDGKSDFSSYVWRVYVLSKWCQEFGFYKKNSTNENKKENTICFT
jgi:asparagine synthase (glutamine-hydrolysing)